jgi:hypothetical protein
LLPTVAAAVYGRRKQRSTATEVLTVRRLHLLLVPAAAALLVTAPASAQTSTPGTFAISERGSLLVASSVLVERRVADMRGGWTDDRISCRASRTLKVSIEIHRTSGGNPAGEVQRSKSGSVTNCAEGGPNFGFGIRAANVGLACPNGAWRPGRYDFVTRTRHRKSGLRSTATLFFRVTEPC